MISVYGIKDLGERAVRKILDALKILSGMNPSTPPESQVTEEETSSPSGLHKRESSSSVKRMLSANQRGRYGRH